MQWFAQAPSNIALIKYMGKSDEAHNLPANPSLSWTLKHLVTSVSLEKIPGRKDRWEPLETPGSAPFSLSKSAETRFLEHLSRMKAYFGHEGAFVVRSSNNFPKGCGLASSASSFAALTRCSVEALCELTGRETPSVEEQAALSREGSGSSCRSFYSPWALWRDETVCAMDFPCGELFHQVLVLSHEEKSVSSSEAHRRILTSPLYAGRTQRAEDNLKTLIAALEHNDWAAAAQTAWREFHDMHSLFETASEPFTYRTPEVRNFLNQLEMHWQDTGDGPIVTMDAGPNIHLLYRPDQTGLARALMQDKWLGNCDVL